MYKDYKANYEKAVQASLEVLMYCNITKFPVEPMDIIKHYGWDCVSYSRLAKQHRCSIYDIALGTCSDDGVLKGNWANPFIIYNDSKSNTRNRIRFSLAHEIGHAILGHNHPFVLKELKEQRKKGVSFLYDELEKEASCFARNLLCHISIIGNLWGDIPEDELIKLFGFSRKAASVRNDSIKYDISYIHNLDDFSFLYEICPFINDNLVRHSFPSEYLTQILEQYQLDRFEEWENSNPGSPFNSFFIRKTIYYYA